MKAWIPLTLVFALGAAVEAQADCTYPRAPDHLPDGATASNDEMIAAKNDVNRYNNEMNAYLECIKLEIQAVPKDPKMSKDDKAKADEQEKMLTQKNNAAVDELNAIVGRFNEQLKIWKAKNAS
jgi:predicted outer membrane protein